MQLLILDRWKKRGFLGPCVHVALSSHEPDVAPSLLAAQLPVHQVLVDEPLEGRHLPISERRNCGKSWVMGVTRQRRREIAQGVTEVIHSPPRIKFPRPI